MPESATLSPSGKALRTLGQGAATGTLRHDKSVYVDTGPLVSDGNIITRVSGCRPRVSGQVSSA
ncbi:hypothetical protein MYK68_19400 [Gordonia sp. PP30]|uniref:hypothetical protein n=1 Tax=Gordonia sp. PP30 TaxID=2935861 RepID=UPI001FFF1B7C|nr:hypothetical protein [Gordonia sp. PP30]UQE74839.1 hypothetical protein MYK68_19400 [Gordonia sp. PP30]